MRELEPKPILGRACGAPKSLINYKEYVFLPKKLVVTKNTSKYIAGLQRIHSISNIWTVKAMLNWNHYKSMQATTPTM